MRTSIKRVLLAGALAAVSLAHGETTDPTAGLLVDVKGPIGPATSDFFLKQLERAQEEDRPLLVLRMDTPGGLDSSMRAIIHAILASKVAVVTYVAPAGSRAASAGTYILYASHVAAMAPATNLGAATPVQMGPGGGSPRGGNPLGDPSGQGDDKAKGAQKARSGGAMEHKLVNDAVAYIKGLAKLRGRNEAWAERAVREAASLTAEDALREGVIDLIAPDVGSLLAQLNGRKVTLEDREVTLLTSDLTLEHVIPDWRNKLLALITNPNVAYVFMLLGIYGLFFELSSPGAVLPGVLGGISILIALYAFHVLPVNYAGVALVALGIAFMVGEAFMPSFGALGVGGVIAFVIGSIILMDTDVEGFEVSIPLVVSLSIASAGFFIFVTTLALRQRRRPVVSGREEMLGSVGEALGAFGGAECGHVHIHGERWQARSREPIPAGASVRVRRIDGLTLEVEPIHDPGAAETGPPPHGDTT